METNMKFTMPLAVYAVAFALVACSDDGDGGTNGFNFSNNDADSYSTSDDGSIPLNPSSILPGSDKGTVEYEKEYLCPIEGYDATAKSSCKIYSDGNSVSLVFNVFGSHDGESLNVVMSSIADLDKLVMDMGIVADAVEFRSADPDEDTGDIDGNDLTFYQVSHIEAADPEHALIVGRFFHREGNREGITG